MRIDLITIFPDYFAPLHLSLVGKAIDSGLVELAVHDLRHWTHDVHHTVDDTPFGGGPGMVMTPEPWGEALDTLLDGGPTGEPALAGPVAEPQPGGRGDAARSGQGHGPILIIPSPSGVPFTQALARTLAAGDHLMFACGRYEGIDARVPAYAATRVPTLEVSLGDYVLNGGEVAALAMIEAIVRLLPGVVGNPESLVEESHSPDWDDLLEYPLYTKPASWRGFDVPAVLLSGHHARIAEWRHEQAVELTRARRPDLLKP
jgi:tRNA (guanine37-N1)-methyltransferase